MLCMLIFSYNPPGVWEGLRSLQDISGFDAGGLDDCWWGGAIMGFKQET